MTEADLPSMFPPPPPPAATPAKSKRGLIIGAGVVLVAAVVAVVVLAGGGSDKTAHTITGTFTLTDDDIDGDWEHCEGTGGYDDVGAGLNVTARDDDGTIVGSGSGRNLAEADIGDMTLDKAIELPDDTPMDLSLAALLAEVSSTTCVLYFEVDVKDTEFYTVEAGHRGELSFSREELADRDWFVQFTLGD